MEGNLNRNTKNNSNQCSREGLMERGNDNRNPFGRQCRYVALQHELESGHRVRRPEIIMEDDLNSNTHGNVRRPEIIMEDDLNSSTHRNVRRPEITMEDDLNSNTHRNVSQNNNYDNLGERYNDDCRTCDQQVDDASCCSHHSQPVTNQWRPDRNMGGDLDRGFNYNTSQNNSYDNTGEITYHHANQADKRVDYISHHNQFQPIRNEWRPERESMYSTRTLDRQSVSEERLGNGGGSGGYFDGFMLDRFSHDHDSRNGSPTPSYNDFEPARYAIRPARKGRYLPTITGGGERIGSKGGDGRRSKCGDDILLDMTTNNHASNNHALRNSSGNKNPTSNSSSSSSSSNSKRSSSNSQSDSSSSSSSNSQSDSSSSSSSNSQSDSSSIRNKSNNSSGSNDMENRTGNDDEKSPSSGNSSSSSSGSSKNNDSSSSSDKSSNSDNSSSGSSGSGSGSGSSSTTNSSSGSDEGAKTKKKKKKIKKRRNWKDKIMKSNPDDQKLLKAVFWFPVGVAISALLYYLIWRKMALEPTRKILIGLALCLLISLTFAFSVGMRCVLCLVLPTFLGKAGRGYIAAFAIIYLISGPITNIVDNAKEVVRSLSCTSELLANHTKEKWKLRLHPVEGAIGDITKDGFLLERVSKKIEKAFAPLKKEIKRDKKEEKEMEEQIEKAEKMTHSHDKTVKKLEKQHKKDQDADDKAERIEKEWEKKMELRCQDTFSKGVIRCQEKMRDLESKCMDALSIIGHLMCLPLKVTIFCQIIKLLPGAVGMDCDSMDVMPPGFGRTFNDADEVIDDMDQGMKVKMQYKLVGADQPDLDYTPVLELRQAAMHDVSEKSRVVERLLTLVSTIMAFTFLRVFKAAYGYNGRYLGDLTFDNIYITSYYRHIDARRRAQGKKTLLPLKKKERQDTISPTRVGLTKSEKAKLNRGTGLLVFRVIISAIIVYMDSLVYQILDIISRNGRVEYHQEGEHTVDIKVYGRGFMSGLVQSFLTKFNSKHTLNKVTSNQDCLPVPSQTDDVILGFLFGAYIMVWFFMRFEAYGLRMRRPIAAFFYRKREKKRVLYLYNKMFRTRVGYIQHMAKTVRKQIKAKELKLKVGMLASLMNTFPRLCGCLRMCVRQKITCIICDDKKDERFHHCPTEGCGISYCHDCWRDIKRRCLACREGDNDDDDVSMSDYDEDNADDSDSD